jgi:hypothetical protein
MPMTSTEMTSTEMTSTEMTSTDEPGRRASPVSTQ